MSEGLWASRRTTILATSELLRRRRPNQERLRAELASCLAPGPASLHRVTWRRAPNGYLIPVCALLRHSTSPRKYRSRRVTAPGPPESRAVSASVVVAPLHSRAVHPSNESRVSGPCLTNEWFARRSC